LKFLGVESLRTDPDALDYVGVAADVFDGQWIDDGSGGFILFKLK